MLKARDGSRTVTDSAGNKVTYDAKGNKVKTELVNEYNRATAESVKEALNGKKEEEKKEEKKEEKPAATTQTTGSDLSKIKSALAEQCKSGDSICKTCANSVKSTDPNKAAAEAQACVEKLNAKQDELQKEYDQEMEKWCKQKGVKEECFMAPEGADANLTAACKKCGFKMASPSK